MDRHSVDRTDEVGEKGICSVCGKRKFIRGSWEEKIFCDDCFGKENPKD